MYIGLSLLDQPKLIQVTTLISAVTLNKYLRQPEEKIDIHIRLCNALKRIAPSNF